MPIGPNGERRPVNAIESGIMVARIAVGDIEEEYDDTPSSSPNRSKGGKNASESSESRDRFLTGEQLSEIAFHIANDSDDSG